jgi:alkylated DNA nucleotide flippase Atl1
MASARAQEVAELLWEMKRAGKIGSFTAVARKAGFSPGAGGRTIQTVLKTVRRDWPHLQWWRVFPDDGLIAKDGEQAELAAEAGFEFVDDKDDKVKVVDFTEHLMVWEDEAAEVKTDEEE